MSLRTLVFHRKLLGVPRKLKELSIAACQRRIFFDIKILTFNIVTYSKDFHHILLYNCPIVHYLLIYLLLHH